MCEDTVRLPLVPATSALKTKVQDFVNAF